MFSFLRRKKPGLVANITNGPGTFSVDVVGESHWQDTLEKICGGKTERGYRLEVEVHLLPVDDNPHDDQAVLVVIGDKPIGYLDRETARSFRRQMGKVAPVGTPAVCRGLIVGGWDRGDGDQEYFGVKLDLPTNN